MLFLTFSNVNLWFAEKGFIWKNYITTKALSITNRVKSIEKNKFVKAALDENFETSVIYVATILEKMSIYLAKETQIAFLQTGKASIKVLVKYSDYANVFSPKLAMELSENTGINEHAINFIEGK